MLRESPRRMCPRNRSVVTAALALAVTLVGALGAPSPPAGAAARPPENVKMRLSFTPFAAHIPFYVAQGKGYFAENGLEVEILPGRGSGFAAQVVGSGTEQFGLADAASMITARSRGVPIVSLGNTQQDSGVALFATVKSGIQKPEEIKGRSVGVFAGSTTEIFLKAFLAKHGMTMNDIKPIIVRPGGDLPLVLDGRIEAMSTVYNNELIAWKILQPQLDLRIWRMSELGFDAPGYAVIANEAFLKEKPQVVRGFVVATFKALEYANAHPEEAVDLLVKGVPELKAPIELAKWKAMIPGSTSPVTERRGLGAHDRPKWEALAGLLKTYEVIKQDVNFDALLHDEYLPKKGN